jgi:hypothetical protein
MPNISCLVHSLATGTGSLLLQTLESLYARCQSQTLRAIHPDAGRFPRPRLGPA